MRPISPRPGSWHSRSSGTTSSSANASPSRASPDSSGPHPSIRTQLVRSPPDEEFLEDAVMATETEKFPSQSQLVLPLLEVLDAAGGRASVRDAADALAERFGLDEETRKATTFAGAAGDVNAWDRH